MFVLSFSSCSRSIFAQPGLGLKVIAIMAGFSAFWFPIASSADTSEQTTLEATRKVLLKEGFKIDLKEFDLSATSEMRARTAALTNQEFTSLGYNSRLAGRGVRVPIPLPEINLLRPIGSNSAVVVWREKELLLDRRNDEADMWPRTREELAAIKTPLDAACESALAGPISFHLDAQKGGGMLLPHLFALKSLSQALGRNAMLELHNGHTNEAWTNISASTRLVTAWQPEPADVSHLLWFALTTFAFNTLWQALQAPVWTDEQLARLQREWEQVDFFSHAPEIPAFTRAWTAALCQQERLEPLQSGITAQEMIENPRGVFNEIGEYRTHLKYLDHGSYEDETAILLHYRDRELELKRVHPRSLYLEWCKDRSLRMKKF